MADNGNSTPVDQRHPECIQISNTSLSSKLGCDFENNIIAHFNLVSWERLKTYCEPRTLSAGCTFKIFLVDSNLMELCLGALSQASSLSKNTNRFSASSSKNNLYILTTTIQSDILREKITFATHFWHLNMILTAQSGGCDGHQTSI